MSHFCLVYIVASFSLRSPKLRRNNFTFPSLFEGVTFATFTRSVLRGRNENSTPLKSLKLKKITQTEYIINAMKCTSVCKLVRKTKTPLANSKQLNYWSVLNSGDLLLIKYVCLRTRLWATKTAQKLWATVIVF